MAHKIDTPHAVTVMPVAAGAGTGTPGWFDDTNPLAITELDADWCNMVNGEITNAVVALGGVLDKALVNQLATRLIEVALTNGRFSTSLYAIYDATPGVENYLFQVTGTTSSIVSADNYNARHGYRSGSLSDYVLVDKDRGIDFVKLKGAVPTIMAAIDRATGDAQFHDITAIGKIKNTNGADVVFDDGIDVEGAVTAQGGLKITHETTSAAWDTDHWEATLARRAASITIDFSAHNLASGGSVTLDIAAAGVSTYARCYGVFDNMGGPPPLITQFVSAGSVSLTLWNVGVAAITTSAVLCVDIIDKA